MNNKTKILVGISSIILLTSVFFLINSNESEIKVCDSYVLNSAFNNPERICYDEKTFWENKELILENKR